jgi:hypothetical protein
VRRLQLLSQTQQTRINQEEQWNFKSPKKRKT